jgi:glycosyltransferase involved in cell wall biosynthesis
MVHNDPYIGFIVWLISKWQCRPFIFRITHLIPEEVIMRKTFISRITGNITKYIRDALSRKSNYVLPTSEEMKRTLMASASIPEARCVVLPATVDTVNKYKELACESFVEKTKKELRLVGCEKWIVYLGTLSPSRQLKLIIDCLVEIRKIHEGVGLAVLGVSSVKSHLDDLVSYAENEGVSKAIAWCDPVPDECLPDCISMMDVGLSPFPLDPVMRNNSPLKSLEYLRSGVCVVASKIPESVYILEESRGGLLADFNAQDFAKSVSSLLFEESKKRQKRVLEAKKWIHSHIFLQRELPVPVFRWSCFCE